MEVSDPYGLNEMIAQSATLEKSRPLADPSLDVRGNALLVPRGIPTQDEANRITGEP